jgi:hypothetical protein
LLSAVVDPGLNCVFPVVACFVSLIDDGKNPDEFTRDVLNSCIAKNQITKGKTDAFKVWMPQLAVKTFVAKFTYEPTDMLDTIFFFIAVRRFKAPGDLLIITFKRLNTRNYHIWQPDRRFNI